MALKFTPTFQSSLISGALLWLVGWVSFFHLDRLPGVARLYNKEKVLNWINQNRTLTLLFTEFVNYGVHGVTNPNSTIFATGGTAFNAAMIYGYIPFRQRRRAKHHREDLLQAKQ